MVDAGGVVIWLGSAREDLVRGTAWALTAAKAAERNAKQRDKQKTKDSEATVSLPPDPSPFASPFTILAPKPWGRLKGSKNQNFRCQYRFRRTD